jgi:hypothetical protein
MLAMLRCGHRNMCHSNQGTRTSASVRRQQMRVCRGASNGNTTDKPDRRKTPPSRLHGRHQYLYMARRHPEAGVAPRRVRHAGCLQRGQQRAVRRVAVVDRVAETLLQGATCNSDERSRAAQGKTSRNASSQAPNHITRGRAQLADKLSRAQISSIGAPRQRSRTHRQFAWRLYAQDRDSGARVDVGT